MEGNNMRKFIKIISAITVCILIIGTLASCESSNIAIKIGDREITKEQYTSAAISIKSQFLTSNDLEETDDLWDKYIDTTYSATTQQYVDSMIQTYLITYNLYAIHFDELGLKLDTETEKSIEETLNGLITQAGSKEALEANLKEQGFTYEEFANQYYNEAKKQAVIMYYFGPEGKKQPVSETELERYYSEYYTKVKHVFFSTKDKEGNDLSIPDRNAVGDKAQKVYDLAIGGADFDELIDEYGEDPGMTTNPDGYIFSTEDTSYTAKFHTAAFDMKPDEIRLVQTNLGFHIMKKYPFTTEDIHAKDTFASLIENMMSTEIADFLEELKETIGVEYNDALLEKLSVVNIETKTNTDESESVVTDELKEQLNIDTETEEE